MSYIPHTGDLFDVRRLLQHCPTVKVLLVPRSINFHIYQSSICTGVLGWALNNKDKAGAGSFQHLHDNMPVCGMPDEGFSATCFKRLQPFLLRFRHPAFL